MYLNIPGKYKINTGQHKTEKKSLTKEDAQNVFGSRDDFGDCRIDKRYCAVVTRAHIALSTKREAPLKEEEFIKIHYQYADRLCFRFLLPRDIFCFSHFRITLAVVKSRSSAI